MSGAAFTGDIQGISLTSLAEEFGTPLYVYDTARMTQQYERLKKAFSVKKLGIHYACKALTNINVLKHMHRLGAGADCVSVQEIRLALHAGFKPNQILYTPNCVSIEELEAAIKLGVKINVDNIETDFEELGQKMSEKFNEFCKEYGRVLALIFEPGKYLVSESGYFLVTTNIIKQTTSTVFAGVDSGFNHLIRPMFYDAHHEIVNPFHAGLLH